MRLEGKKIAVLVEDGFEDLEFWVPVMRLREEGAEVVIAGREKGILFLVRAGLKRFRIQTSNR